MSKHTPDDKESTLTTSFPKGEDIVEQVEHVELLRDDGTLVVITRALCPMGHDLILPENPSFDGYPGIALQVASGDTKGLVYLSPFHGDRRKQGLKDDVGAGATCEISCPVCDTVFPIIGSCSCEQHGRLYAIYLSPALKQRNIVGLCGTWGCPRSRVMDNLEIVSEIALLEAEAADKM